MIRQKCSNITNENMQSPLSSKDVEHILAIHELVVKPRNCNIESEKNELVKRLLNKSKAALAFVAVDIYDKSGKELPSERTKKSLAGFIATWV